MKDAFAVLIGGMPEKTKLLWLGSQGVRNAHIIKQFKKPQVKMQIWEEVIC